MLSNQSKPFTQFAYIPNDYFEPKKREVTFMKNIGIRSWSLCSNFVFHIWFIRHFLQLGWALVYKKTTQHYIMTSYHYKLGGYECSYPLIGTIKLWHAHGRQEDAKYPKISRKKQGENRKNEKKLLKEAIRAQHW